MKITSWKKLFAPHILARGEGYYDAGQVESVRLTGSTVTATVQGSELYEVKIDLSGHRVESMYCDCPYAQDGTACKHMAAVLYELTEEDFADELPDHTGQTQTGAEPDLEKAVAALSEAQARQLLLDLARNDEQIAAKVRLCAGDKVSKRQLKTWLRQIDKIINRYSYDGEYVGYEYAWDFTEALEGFLDDTVSPLLQGGLVEEAVTIVNELFLRVSRIEMDDSDGGLSSLFGHCGACWRAALAKAAPAQRRSLYAWFRAQYGDTEPETFAQEYLRDFLFSEFNDPESNNATLTFIDGLLEKTDDRCELETLVRNRLELMAQMGAGLQEIERFEEKYFALPDVRRQRIERLINGRRYDEAIALLQKSREMDAKWPGLVREYSESLLALYQKLDRQAEYEQELNDLLRNFRQDDLTYVRALKKITPAETWPAVRDRLLAQPTLYGVRGDLLVAEGMLHQLMDLVAQDNTHILLDRYEKTLAVHFPEETRDLLASYLRREMQSANNRKQYYTLIQRLKTLKKYPQGQALANQIAQEWRVTYKRRSSLLDELWSAGF